VYSGEAWKVWLTSDHRLEGGQQRHALFSEGGQVAAQAGERVGSAVRAEAPGDLLLDFEQAQIAFRLIVVEGDGQVVKARLPTFRSRKLPDTILAIAPMNIGEHKRGAQARILVVKKTFRTRSSARAR
jgi:hypothetical protein